MYKNITFAFCLLASTCLILPSSGYATSSPAETAPAETTTPSQPPVIHSTILPVKIKPRQEGADGISKAAAPIADENDVSDVDVETLALLSTANDGSLGKNSWANLSRQELRDLVSATPAPLQPILRDLFVRALLSDANLSSGNSTPEKGDDLFTLRLKKLVDAGAFDEAFRLYRRLGSTQPTPSAAQAGIDAMIGTQQLGIACLESKALDPSLRPATTFWSDVQTFCGALLGPASGPLDLEESQRQMNAARLFLISAKLTAPTNLKDLNALTSVRIMALARTGALDTLDVSQKSLESSSLRVLGLLKTYADPTKPFGVSVAAAFDNLTKIVESVENTPKIETETSKEPEASTESLSENETKTDDVTEADKKSQTTDSIDNIPVFAINTFIESIKTGSAIEKEIYDKIFHLTEKLDYVMPTDELIDRLATAKSNKATGAAVFYGLQIFDTAPMEKLNPVAILKVLETWNALGLTTETQSLAQQLQKTFERESKTKEK